MGAVNIAIFLLFEDIYAFRELSCRHSISRGTIDRADAEGSELNLSKAAMTKGWPARGPVGGFASPGFVRRKQAPKLSLARRPAKSRDAPRPPMSSNRHGFGVVSTATGGGRSWS